MAKVAMGVGVTNAGLGGYTPQINRGGYTSLREKRLFKSQREAGLFLEKMVRGGYGEIPAGTILAEMTAAPYDLVPYVPDVIAATDKGRIMLVTDNITATTFKIWKEDMAKLKAADVVVMTDTDGTYEEATVSTVALDADGRLATVTLSAATVTVGGFTVAKSANCYQKAGSAGKRSTAKYMLDQDVFTGEIDNPNGAQTSVFISNGIVYKEALVNLDATAATSLGAVVDGNLVIFK